MPLYRAVNIGTLDFATGQKKSIDIPRDGVAVQYNIRVQYTCTNGATGPTTPHFQTLARLLRRVDVVLGGRDTVVSQSGESLAARAQYEWGTPADGMADTVVLTNSAATVYDVTIPIPRFLPRSMRPLMCADDLRAITQATLEITWGTSDAANLFGTTNSAAISAVTCWVEVEYLIDMPAPAEAAFAVRQLSEIVQDYSAANDNLSVTIDGQTGLAVRTIAFAALDNLVGSNSLVNSWKLQAGTDIFHQRKAPALQAKNKIEFGQESLITGYYFQPLTFAGDPGMSINTDPRVIPADLKAVFDVSTGSGAEKLVISVESIRPPKFRAA